MPDPRFARVELTDPSAPSPEGHGLDRLEQGFPQHKGSGGGATTERVSGTAQIDPRFARVGHRVAHWQT